MGLFITFEGIDGSGKSLQIKYLKDFFQNLDKDIIITREPGGTKIGEQVRNIVLSKEHTDMNYTTEALLYAASRAQLVGTVIKPALMEDKIVICDRFVDSSIMYQGVLRGLGVENIQTINDFALQNIKPDITFLLDTTVEVSNKRMKSRNKLDRLDSENDDFYRRLRCEYLTLASKNRDRIVVIDSIPNPQVVHNSIINVLKNRKLV